MNKVLAYFSIIFMMILFFLAAETVSAEEYYFYKDNIYIYPQVQDYSVVSINEIMPNPEGSDTDYEWIELYNESEQEIDLTDCKIDGRVFEAGTIISSKSYFVVAKDLLDEDLDDESFENRWGNGSDIWGDDDSEDYDAQELAISMKNSSDSVVLECDDYIEEVEWTDAESGQSFSKDENGDWTDEYMVTPGDENQAPEPIVYSHKILISEVYPSPQSEEVEWVELYNFSDKKIDLTEWSIGDNSKNQMLEDLIVKADSYLVLSDEDLKITLNNSGDKITLSDPNEELVDTFKYIETDKGISNIRKWKDGKYENKVVQSKKPTKGKRNVFVDPDDVFSDIKVESIKKVREKKPESNVAIEGVVTVEINKLGSKAFYIQDSSGGIQVYLYDEALWKNFQVGDKLRVFGELKESYGEMRLYANDENSIKKISSENKIEPYIIKTGSISNSVEGRLVFISGKIVETSGNTFYINDGTGKVKVYIKSTSGIDVPDKEKGQFAGVTGIVSQYGSGDEGFRVLPRANDDIRISNEPVKFGDVLGVTGVSIFSIQYVGLFMFIYFSFKKINTIYSKYQSSMI